MVRTAPTVTVAQMKISTTALIVLLQGMSCQLGSGEAPPIGLYCTITGIMAFLCLPLRHLALASGGGRRLGWKHYWSVQLKQVLRPNTKLMVVSVSSMQQSCLLRVLQPAQQHSRINTTLTPCPGCLPTHRHPTLPEDQHIDAAALSSCAS